MMNNPVMGILGQMIRGGAVNPQAMIQGLMKNSQIMSNPMMNNALQMYQNGDMQGLQNMANNLAKERGTSVEQVKNDIMAQFGIK